MYGRPVSVGTLYYHSRHTGDRASDCASPIYPVCALYVVVTAAALGLAAWKAPMGMLPKGMLSNVAGGTTTTERDSGQPPLFAS
jgi:hypothetical protein